MRRAAVAVVVALGLVAAGCSPSEPELRLGARAIAVDLAFSEPSLATPVEPEVIVRIIPAPPEVVSGELTVEEAALPAGSPPPSALTAPPRATTCPAAPEGAAPAEVAPVGIKAPPRPGTYGRHNTGTFGISAPGLNLRLTFPPETTDAVSAPREVAPPGPLDPLLGGEAREQKGSGLFEWTVAHTITPTFVTRTTYRLTPTALQIVRRTTTSGAGEQVTEPSPPVTLVELNRGIGHSWRSAGVDRARRTALSIEGRIESTEAVDLCGELIDTYRLTTKETFVNLETGESSGTDADGANVYNVATHHGGLLVRSELHFSQQTRDARTGAPIVISYDYTSTMDAVRPRS